MNESGDCAWVVTLGYDKGRGVPRKAAGRLERREVRGERREVRRARQIGVWNSRLIIRGHALPSVGLLRSMKRWGLADASGYH
jgi:hypothetical protein